MDLKELSESVQQQSAPVPLISPKRQIHSRFQLNLNKTIESCKAQLGINEILEDVYRAVEHTDLEDSEKSDSSGSDSISDEEQRSKNEPEDARQNTGCFQQGNYSDTNGGYIWSCFVQTHRLYTTKNEPSVLSMDLVNDDVSIGLPANR